MKASTRARGPPDGPSVSGRPHCFSSRGTSTPGSNSKAVAHPAGTWCRNNRSTSRAALSAPAAAAVAATSSSVEGGQAVRAAAAAAPAAAVDLTGRDVAILLDIENVGIFAPLDTCLIQVHRLRSLVTERWGGRLERFAAAANTTTVARLRQSGVDALLEAGGVDLTTVGSTHDAADAALSAQAFEFSTKHRDRGALLCLSKDGDFRQVLHYATSLGVYTVVAAPFNIRKSSAPPLPGRALNIRALQESTLPGVCRAAVVWSRQAAAVTDAERRFCRDCLDAALAAAAAAAAAAGAAAASDDSGNSGGGGGGGSLQVLATSRDQLLQRWASLESAPGVALHTCINLGNVAARLQ